MIRSKYALIAAVLALTLGPTTMDLVGNWSVGRLWLPTWLGALLPTIAFFLLLALFVAAALFALVAVGCVVKKEARAAKVAGALFVSAVGGICLSLATSQAPLPFATPLKGLSIRTRVDGFAQLAKEAQPIVLALRRFEDQNARPARALTDLVPRFLPSLPTWSDRLRYYSSSEPTTRPLYGNTWILWVDASWGLGFDCFVYFPNQVYPEFMYGGGIEKVGEWVYVHE